MNDLFRKEFAIRGRPGEVEITPRKTHANDLRYKYRRRHGEENPALRIRIGTSEIVGVQMKVKGAHEGGIIIDGSHQGKQFFANGEKVLEIHVNTVHPTDAIRLIDLLIEHLPEIKKIGFSGLYGYTPTHAIAQAFIKKTKGNVYEAEEVIVTEDEKANAKRYYKARIPKHGFPQEHLQNEVIGVAIKF
ncbi:MAG TPA: hypothetical protein VFF13_01830 [archaeon]|nr:hypothetical protein [archaeon]